MTYCCKDFKMLVNKEVINLNSELSSYNPHKDTKYMIQYWYGEMNVPFFDGKDISFCPFCGKELEKL